MAALHPPAEEDRLSACIPFEVLRRTYKWGDALKAGELINKAKLEFGTKYAYLSLFSKGEEEFIVDDGMNRTSISREYSIGGHVVLSQDALIPHDTRRV